MGPDAKLLAIEINPGFCELLDHTIDDPRLIVHHGSAADIPEALAKHELGSPDVVLSGIPFSTMPRELGISILESVKASLAPGGRFVAYQFRDVVHTLGKQVFGPASVQLELLNVPPMRVYRWDMPFGRAASAEEPRWPLSPRTPRQSSARRPARRSLGSRIGSRAVSGLREC